MTRSTRLAWSLVVAAGLAVPTVAGAQTAVARPTSSGSAGSSGTSGSSSSGGESRTSGSERGSQPPSVSRSSAGEGQRRAPAGSSRSGSATSRGSSASGRSGSSSGGSAERGDATRGGSPTGRIARDRDGRITRGTAVERPYSNRPITIPIYRYWYPYYGGYGYGGWGYGGYGYGRWSWTPYGWHSFYWPYDPYWDDRYGGYDRDDRDDRDESERMTGNVRLRVNPSEATVYIDGALVGRVDDFDGLTNHLELEGGTHQIEIRMDGYETYRGEISVQIGKTRTERLSLKKIK